jgi:2-phospho-L-lactate transferase/gluconeogenesis factor (CofD/UPF0052 family)
MYVMASTQVVNVTRKVKEVSSTEIRVLPSTHTHTHTHIHTHTSVSAYSLIVCVYRRSVSLKIRKSQRTQGGVFQRNQRYPQPAPAMTLEWPVQIGNQQQQKR